MIDIYPILIYGWLALINIIAFAAMGLDKSYAKRRRRIPEARLIGYGILGGSIGAIAGMAVFRHKTLHKKFTIGLPLILTAQLILAALLLYWLN